jgi:hypothetical protein
VKEEEELLKQKIRLSYSGRISGCKGKEVLKNRSTDSPSFLSAILVSVFPQLTPFCVSSLNVFPQTGGADNKNDVGKGSTSR